MRLHTHTTRSLTHISEPMDIIIPFSLYVSVHVYSWLRERLIPDLEQVTNFINLPKWILRLAMLTVSQSLSLTSAASIWLCICGPLLLYLLCSSFHSICSFIIFFIRVAFLPLFSLLVDGFSAVFNPFCKYVRLWSQLHWNRKFVSTETHFKLIVYIVLRRQCHSHSHSIYISPNFAIELNETLQSFVCVWAYIYISLLLLIASYRLMYTYCVCNIIAVSLKTVTNITEGKKNDVANVDWLLNTNTPCNINIHVHTQPPELYTHSSKIAALLEMHISLMQLQLIDAAGDKLNQVKEKFVVRCLTNFFNLKCEA